MRIERSEGGTKLWLSAEDTYNWANRPDNAWPCSFLSGRRLFAAFDANGDLADMAVDGGKGDQDCPADEFDAITKDALKTE